MLSPAVQDSFHKHDTFGELVATKSFSFAMPVYLGVHLFGPLVENI